MDADDLRHVNFGDSPGDRNWEDRAQVARRLLQRSRKFRSLTDKELYQMVCEMQLSNR